MDPDRPRHDLATVVAIAVVAYALADVLHEGVGHGGACLLMGGNARVLSSVHFDCDTSQLSSWAERFIAAGGTLANLAAGLLMLGLLRQIERRASGDLVWFLWLSMTINLLQGTGYFLFSGLGGIGDWAEFVRGLGPTWLARVVLSVLGAATYFLVVLLGARELIPFLSGEGAGRVRNATRLTVPAYIAGGVLSCVAGLLNPVGMVLVAISAAAASFGGTSGLAWMPQLLHSDRPGSPLGDPLLIRRSPGWIAAGVVTTLGFVLVLGPGLRFGTS